MMQKLLPILACILCSVFSFGDNRTDSIFRERCTALDLPILYITTVDSVMPTYTVVYAPEGCSGRGITNNEKVPARMWIVQRGDTIFDTGVYAQDTSGVTIKVRGNTTGSDKLAKKPYKLKLQQKADLLFRGNNAVYADKEWVLLRDQLYGTIVGNMTNRALGMEWTPAQTPVFLFLNGDFRGVYMLSENIKRNTKCRVNIDKIGYLYEFDAYWWNEDFYIASPKFGPRINYTLKYPDPDDILPWQVEYMTNHINRVENAFITPNVLDSAIDIHSYARWLWVHDMLGNRDGAGSNLFISKYDTTAQSKQKMICAWDFDACYTPNIEWSEVHNHFWFNRFFVLPQTQFVQEYIRLYDSTVYGLFNQLVNDIQALRQTAEIAALDSAYVLDRMRWGQLNPATIQLETIAAYLTQRKPLIDSLMTDMKADYNYVSTALPLNTQKDVHTTATFDILGRPINENSQGTLMIIRQADGSVRKVIR